MATGTFSTQATKNIGDLAGATDQNFGNVAVPASAVPEPAYGLFLLPALAALVIWHRRSAKAAIGGAMGKTGAA